MLDEAYQITK